MPFLQTAPWMESYGDLGRFGRLLKHHEKDDLCYIPDYWTVPNLRPKLINERLRTPQNALTGKVSEQERFHGLPPLGSKELFIGFTGEQAARMEIDRAQAIVAEHKSQIEMSTDVLTSDNIGEAIRQSLVDHHGEMRYKREAVSVPYQCELILTECNSACPLLPTNNNGAVAAGVTRLRSLLHIVHNTLVNEWIECLKIVGNTHRYYYGTQLIIDEQTNVLWPDDKSMTRVVSFLANDVWYTYPNRKWDPEFLRRIGKAPPEPDTSTPPPSFSAEILDNYFKSSMCTIWSGEMQDWPGIHPGMRRPEVYTRPGSTARIWIDSFSDMVSTVACAVRDMNEEDIRGLDVENNSFWRQRSYELKWLFNQFRNAIEAKALEDEQDMDIILLKAHLVASFFDASRYREVKGRLYENIVTNSLVVKRLHDYYSGQGLRRVIELPKSNLTGFWTEALITEIEDFANQAIARGSQGIRILNKRSPPHAGRVLPETIALPEGSEEVCDGISIRDGAPTQLAIVNAKNYRTIVVTRGPIKGVRYHIKLKTRGKSVAYKASSRVSLWGKLAGGAVNSVGEVKVATFFGVNPEKWFFYTCPLGEVFDIALSGDCREGDSRWALTAILSGSVKLSNRSTIRYVPSRLFVNDEDAIDVSTNLDPELTGELPMIIAKNSNSEETTLAGTMASSNESSTPSQASVPASVEEEPKSLVYTQLQHGKELFRVVVCDEILDLEELSAQEAKLVHMRTARMGVLKYSMPIGGSRDV